MQIFNWDVPAGFNAAHFCKPYTGWRRSSEDGEAWLLLKFQRLLLKPNICEVVRHSAGCP